GIKWRGDQQECCRVTDRPRDEEPGQPPASPKTKCRIQSLQQHERCIRLGKNEKPHPGDPGPEWPMLMIAKLKLLAPGIGLEHIVMKRFIGACNSGVNGPGAEKEKERGGCRKTLRD